MISKLKWIVASAAVLGLSTVALAKGDHQMSPRKAAMLAKFDTNKDGSLDKTEKTAMREQRIEKRFAKLDANKDGAVTLAEMKAAKHHGKGKRGKGRGRMIR